jgi:hypothetical protein
MFSLEESKFLINKIFEEFCFASEKDKTHAIAAFITPFLRGIFPKFSTRTPVFIYMANRERAGKDYCAGCSGMLYEGANVEEPAISNDEKGISNANEEIRKKIMACMMQGKKRFHSANNKGLLNNSVLEGVTTAEVWNDRVLGRSENVTFDNEMDYSLSGNLGIRLTPDLANRARIINLHLIDEDANARKFKNPRLHEWILENRGSIISALYTIVDNWVKKGMPNGTIPFTSFPHWANICGGVMETAGYENPCKADKSVIISLDNETEEMKILFEICYSSVPDKWLTKNEIQTIVEYEGIMPGLDFNDKSDQTKFGIKIDKYVNRILSGIIMTVDSLEQRASRRKYKFTKNTSIFTSVNGNGNIGNINEIEKDAICDNVKNDYFLHDEKKLIDADKKKLFGIKNVGEITKIPKSDDFQNLNSERYENGVKNGNLGNFGNVHTPVELGENLYNIYGVRNVTKATKVTKIPDKNNINNVQLTNLEDFSKKYKDFIKKEEEPKKKEKGNAPS